MQFLSKEWGGGGGGEEHTWKPGLPILHNFLFSAMRARETGNVLDLTSILDLVYKAVGFIFLVNSGQRAQYE